MDEMKTSRKKNSRLPAMARQAMVRHILIIALLVLKLIESAKAITSMDPPAIRNLFSSTSFNCDSLAHMIAERPLYSYLNFEDVLFRDMVMGSGLYNDPHLLAEELWKDDPEYYYVKTYDVDTKKSKMLYHHQDNVELLN